MAYVTPQAPMPPEGGPPMPPQGAAPPPPMPPPAAEDAEMLAVQDQEAKIDAIAAGAPQPDEPFSVKKIEQLISEMNRLAEMASGDADIQEIEWSPDDASAKKWNMPLPPAVFVPLVIIGQVVAQLGFDKYVKDPGELRDDKALDACVINLRRMSKDKKLLKALQPPDEGEEMPELPEGEPGDYDDSDEALMM